MGIVTPDSYSATSHYPLTRENVFEIAREVALEVLKDAVVEEVESLIKPYIDTIFDATLQDSLFITNIARRRFDRNGFMSSNPSIQKNTLDSFCLRFRSEINLQLYPEKIIELKELLERENIKNWNPNFVLTHHRGLVGWFGRNIRKGNGKTDWQKINEALGKIYPESHMTYTEKRESFTRESALDLLKNLVQDLVNEKGYWTATSISDRDGELYSYITGLEDFRRLHDRPDLKSRMSKTGERFSQSTLSSRPNWFAIAKAMGDTFLDTMQIGNIQGHNNEQSLRDIGIACEELDFTVQVILRNRSAWKPRDIQDSNQALYRWFQAHCSLEGMKIDWSQIIPQCNETTQNTFRK